MKRTWIGAVTASVIIAGAAYAGNAEREPPRIRLVLRMRCRRIRIRLRAPRTWTGGLNAHKLPPRWAKVTSRPMRRGGTKSSL
jgi:hypothetical protein